MAKNHVPGSSDVGTLYDRMSEVLMEALGDNIHYGFWDDDNDDTPVREATDRLTDMVAQRLDLAAGARVLDVGCGTGRSTLRIADRHRAHVTGVTLSPREVQLAMTQPGVGLGIGQATFQLADAMELPFPDGHFDSAYAIESIAHMPDRGKAIAEIARTLRPGGRLVIQDFFLAHTPTPRELEALTAVWDIFEFPPFGTQKDFEDDITAAGLDLVAYENITTNLRRTMRLIVSTLRSKAEEPEIEKETRDFLAELVVALEQLMATGIIRHSLITARRR
ncbi:methyltransferase domain-containing protein [Streptomyces sp. NPDC051987]|uniref:methyltransferase domain-containing protein n=1 Tax=Streptomyces sp. NPDC051987 TaxID=3155808 RepID=UPI0034428E79